MKGNGDVELDLCKLDSLLRKGNAFMEKAQNQAHSRCSTNAARSDEKQKVFGKRDWNGAHSKY